MPLFKDKKELFCFLAICFLLFFINLSYKYIKFYTFINNGEQEVVAKVQSNYVKINKNGKEYRLLTLKTDDFKFYTTTLKSRKFGLNETLKVTIINIDVSFFDYLKGSFFAPNLRIKKVDFKPDFKDKLLNSVSNQHQNEKLSEFYSALYFATPISQDMRSDIARWGISHLVAISGYHLGLILSLLYFVFFALFKPLYARFYPYRNYKIDIFIISFVFVGFYFWILGLVPSFLRAFLMCLIGFYFMTRGLKVLSFLNLLVVVCLCLAIFPNLLFSVGFYLSVMGVFYIFLYLYHFKHKSILNFILFNIYLFLAMQVVVLYFFPIISFQQFAVVVIGYIFGIFYPVSVVLHIFGIGGIIDEYLLEFINFSLKVGHIKIDLWQFLLYNLVSILAIKFKNLAILLPIFGAICFISLV